MSPAIPLLALLLAAAAPAERVVALVPLGEVDPALVKLAVEAMRAQVACKVRVEPARALPKAAWYAPRQRWRAERILEALEKEPPENAWKVLALTSAEISTTKGSIPDWRVGGLGEVGGRAGVVSTWINERRARTKEDLHRRIADLVVHELGHTLGLQHCAGAGCVMRDAKGRLLEAQDVSRGRFCEMCRRRTGAGIFEGSQ